MVWSAAGAEAAFVVVAEVAAIAAIAVAAGSRPVMMVGLTAACRWFSVLTCADKLGFENLDPTLADEHVARSSGLHYFSCRLVASIKS